MRPRHFVTLLVLLAVVLPLAVASAPTPAHAGGVVTVCDEAHLLGALAGGGMVTFSCSGTISLTATITISADTSIDGSGQTVTISGNNAVRVFTVNSGGILNLNKLTIAGGRTVGNGGGVYIDSGTLAVRNSTFFDNSAVAGGGIYNHFGTVTVSNCTFASNRVFGSGAVAGGGIYNHFGTMMVSNSSFMGNGGFASGGGIWNNNGTLTVSDSTFSGNRTFGPGGGIGNDGTLTVNNSTFEGNDGFSSGGGIANYGTLVVNNSTFYNNSADNDSGGGIANYGTLVMSNSTFSSNRAHDLGGSIYNYASVGAVATLKNTIIANSPAGGNCYGAIVDGGGNLSYPDTTCPGTNSDPVLGPLQNNGGPTHTMALLPSSAAIDAGDDAICAAPPVNNRDQRGTIRPQGAHCDIGAYEALPSSIVSVCDEAHLLAALVGGGTVTFNCSGTIILTAMITIAADTTIDSSRQSVTISGNNAVRVFTVNPGVAVTLNALTITNGSAVDGGGIYNSGTLIVSNSTFDGNSARGDYPGPNFGGGIYNNNGALTVSNSTFSSNGAYDGGGGIYNKSGTLTVSNSTFAGNGAARGGAIYNGNGALTVSNSTFAGNSAYGGGGSIYNHDSGGAVTTLRNTIVANSPAGANCFGTIADGSGNLTYPDTTCPGINFIPALGPLQNNGGATKTMALLAGSTAIDRANDVICAAAPINNRDQRGVVRPQGFHCDIGAYEVLPPHAFLPIIMR